MKWIKVVHYTSVLLVLSCVSSCFDSQTKTQDNRIISISSPISIDDKLAKNIVFLEKNVDDQSIIAILSLDLTMDKISVLPNEVNQPVLSPDNQSLTYVRREQLGGISPHSIWIYDLTSNEERKVAGWKEDILDIWLTRPSFSYDGLTIIFTVTWFDTEHIGLAVTDINGEGLKILKINRPIAHGAVFSPDGSRFIVNCPGIDELTGDPGYQLCLFDSNGLFLDQLTNRGDYNSSYYFTPNGKYIAYSEVEFGGLFQIINKRIDRFIIMDTDGKNKEVLLYWDVGIHGFSDDSQQIIFEGRPNPKSPWGIYIINIDGTNLRHLTYFDEFLEEWYSDIEEY